MTRAKEIEGADRIRSDGFTLVEMVVVIALLGIIGLVPSYVIVESMRVYARIAPKVDAAYQARLAVGRMRQEIRGIKACGTITSMTPTAFSFAEMSGNPVAYTLSSGKLLRNGDLLAQGVASLAFSYWQSDGSVASTASELHLVEIDLTVQTGSEPYRVQVAVFPRHMGLMTVSSGPLDIAASVATVATQGSKKFSLDLVSRSSADLVIVSLELGASRAMPNLKTLKLAAKKIWSGNQSLPTGPLTMNKGTTTDQTVPAGGNPKAQLDFKSAPTAGAVQYTLVIRFTDGTSSSLAFSVTW